MLQADPADRSAASPRTTRRVAIVGGGLAGLAAATRLAEDPRFAVSLFESRQTLGGRAGTYHDPAANERFDYCQHVGMGCCTNFEDFCRRNALTPHFERHAEIPFFGPGGEGPFWLRRTPGLPAPLHLARSLFSFRFLSLRDRIGIARGLVRMGRRRPDAPDEPCLEWLTRHGQSPNAVERFWSVVLVSALGESLDRVSVNAARKVFVDGFLCHPDAFAIDVPTSPLGRLLDENVRGVLEQRGVRIHSGTRIRTLMRSAVAGAPTFEIEVPNGSVRTETFDALILAVGWRQVTELLGPELVTPELRSEMAWLDAVPHFHSSPITGVHLWLDRPVMSLPHAVLVERLSQWVFNRGTAAVPEFPQEQPEGSETNATEDGGQYLQVVISASRNLHGRAPEAILAEIRSDLELICPASREARVVRHRVVSQPHAVFSYSPDLDLQRPAPRTPLPGLILAGDWTRTGWPSTMEGAVRSGYRAVEQVLELAGEPRELVCPDLPKSWLARLLGFR